MSFFLTFVMVQLLVASITHHVGPFGWVEMGGHHVHHLVWGILLLLITGYAELAEMGTGDSSVAIFQSRLLALAYGIGAALTLDEFALWLNLDPAASGPGRAARALMPWCCLGRCWQWARGVRRYFAGLIRLKVSVRVGARKNEKRPRVLLITRGLGRGKIWLSHLCASRAAAEPSFSSSAWA